MSSSPDVKFEKVDTPSYQCPECEAVLLPSSPPSYWFGLKDWILHRERYYFCRNCHQEYLVTVGKQ